MDVSSHTVRRTEAIAIYVLMASVEMRIILQLYYKYITGIQYYNELVMEMCY